eukprot:m.229544 g.229544  ORF g.229544 m.229544 type:complete len:1367 (+) comp17341_c0_seq1:82-4182(+)
MSNRLDEQAVNRLLQASDAVLSAASSPSNSRSASLMDLPAAVENADTVSSAVSTQPTATASQDPTPQAATTKAQSDLSARLFSLVKESDQALSRAKSAKYGSITSFSSPGHPKTRSPSLERRLLVNASNATMASPLSSTGTSIRDPASSRASSGNASLQGEAAADMELNESAPASKQTLPKLASSDDRAESTSLEAGRTTFTPPPRQSFGDVASFASNSPRHTPPVESLLETETKPDQSSQEQVVSTTTDPEFIPSAPSTPSIAATDDSQHDQQPVSPTSPITSTATPRDPTQLLSQPSSVSEPEPTPRSGRLNSSTDEAWDLGDDFEDPFTPTDDEGKAQTLPPSPQRGSSAFKLGLDTLNETSTAAATAASAQVATPTSQTVSRSAPATNPPAYRPSLTGITITESPKLPRATTPANRVVRSTTITTGNRVKDIFSRTRQLASGVGVRSPSTPQPVQRRSSQRATQLLQNSQGPINDTLRILLEHGSPLLHDAVDQADIHDAWLSSQETDDWEDDEFRAVTPFFSTALDEAADDTLTAAGLELLLGPWLEPSCGDDAWISPVMATWQAAMDRMHYTVMTVDAYRCHPHGRTTSVPSSPRQSQDYLSVRTASNHSLSAPNSPRRADKSVRASFEGVVEPPTLADVDTLRRVKTLSQQDTDVAVTVGDIILQAARPKLQSSVSEQKYHLQLGLEPKASGLMGLLRLLRLDLHPLQELLTAHGHEAFLLRLPIHKRRDSVIDLQYTYSCFEMGPVSVDDDPISSPIASMEGAFTTLLHQSIDNVTRDPITSVSQHIAGALTHAAFTSLDDDYVLAVVVDARLCERHSLQEAVQQFSRTMSTVYGSLSALCLVPSAHRELTRNLECLFLRLASHASAWCEPEQVYNPPFNGPGLFAHSLLSARGVSLPEDLALAVRQVFRQLDLDCNTHLHQKHAALLAGLSLLHKGILIHSTMQKDTQHQLGHWLRLIGLLDVASHHSALHCLLWFPLHDGSAAESSSDKKTIAVVLADGATLLLAQFVVWNRPDTVGNPRIGLQSQQLHQIELAFARLKASGVIQDIERELMGHKAPQTHEPTIETLSRQASIITLGDQSSMSTLGGGRSQASLGQIGSRLASTGAVHATEAPMPTARRNTLMKRLTKRGAAGRSPADTDDSVADTSSISTAHTMVAATHSALYHYVNFDSFKGMLVASESRHIHSARAILGREIMINFQVACRRIRQIFLASARQHQTACVEGQPFHATPRLGVVLEHSIVFSLYQNGDEPTAQETLEADASSDGQLDEYADQNNPAARIYRHTAKKTRKHKEVCHTLTEPSYKVVGRLSPQDCLNPDQLADQLASGNVSELYVCLPADSPDSMAEMAFRMASVL